MKRYLQSPSNGWGLGFLSNAFDDFFKPVTFSSSCHMNTDVKETEKGFDIAVDMPGFDKKDINLSLDNGYLTISAKREQTEEENYLRRERSLTCSRSYYVGDKITEEDVKAKYENGTLNVFVPKLDAKQLPKRNIEIE